MVGMFTNPPPSDEPALNTRGMLTPEQQRDTVLRRFQQGKPTWRPGQPLQDSNDGALIELFKYFSSPPRQQGPIPFAPGGIRGDAVPQDQTIGLVLPSDGSAGRGAAPFSTRLPDVDPLTAALLTAFGPYIGSGA